MFAKKAGKNKGNESYLVANFNDGGCKRDGGETQTAKDSGTRREKKKVFRMHRKQF